MDLPVNPPVKPMLAKPLAGFEAVPDTPIVYEPKWDGFRCIVFRDGDEVVLGSRNERPLTRYFPELIEPIRRMLPHRCTIDGEVIVATNGTLDFDALQQRIHPAETRVNRLAMQTPASFVGFDLLCVDDRDLRAESMAIRREALELAMGTVEAPLHLTPVTRHRDIAQRWFDDFEGAGLDGLIVKPLDGTYVEDKRVQFKLKHQRTVDCAVAGFRWHKDGKGVGSLLLGLFGQDNNLHHLGVSASFTEARRRELSELLVPLTDGALDDHPWGEWARAQGEPTTAAAGGGSRWNAGKDLTFVPIRMELVAEVGYATITSGRFRGTTRFLRWRTDRDPRSCTFDQIEEAPELTLDAVFGARG